MSPTRASFAVLYTLLALAMAVAFLVAPARGDEGQPVSAPSTQPVDLDNHRCPVTGLPVSPEYKATVNGAVVHFCCPNCAAKYTANPDAYAANLRKEPAVAAKMDSMGNAAPAAAPAAAASVEASKGAEFHDAMRGLWADHVTWTRLFIVSALADLPDKDVAAKRLMDNQKEIGDAVKPFYGEDAGVKLTALLKDHIRISADLVGALKAKDQDNAGALSRRWGENADEIATLLHGANPTQWPLDGLKSMLHEHLDVTAAEVKARIDRDWNADVEAYRKIVAQAMKMADMLSDGIRKQFPAKFS